MSRDRYLPPPASASHARAFAILSGMEASTRSVLAAALPIQTQALFGTDESVSALTLAGSVAALAATFLIPSAARAIGRRRLCALGIAAVALASVFFMLHLIPAQIFGFICRAVGSVVFFSAVSMYIMDHVPRAGLGRSEPLRLLCIGLAWTLGPIAGVELEAAFGPWAPFLASIGIAALLLAYFLALPLARHAPPRQAMPVRKLSLANIAAFSRQPRLVLAWLHAVGRSFVWGTFNLYAPLFAVQSGLGAGVGGWLVGVGSGFMLAMPLWGALARQFGIRRISLICFPMGMVGMMGAGLLHGTPWVAVGFMVLGTLSMSIIDGYGNALFLRACKPSQRTEMSPVFSTCKDTAEISQAAMFAVVLIFLPVYVVFIVSGLVLAGLSVLALKINPRL